ncbi:hypothetical protein CBR_g38855 [Chara braunii]|uniref:Uncharacterized protein n=1 Tax=Chara braunii TaxID=69332 RepID=A0A388LQH7_CHABU|nr:hypothetical protein CBR_g38855 [Chara braunii]|eukprot:GBG84574.1 hypothetical protein CBR_g38855 [Chara braunii]
MSFAVRRKEFCAYDDTDSLWMSTMRRTASQDIQLNYGVPLQTVGEEPLSLLNLGPETFGNDEKAKKGREWPGDQSVHFPVNESSVSPQFDEHAEQRNYSSANSPGRMRNSEKALVPFTYEEYVDKQKRGQNHDVRTGVHHGGVPAGQCQHSEGHCGNGSSSSKGTILEAGKLARRGMHRPLEPRITEAAKWQSSAPLQLATHNRIGKPPLRKEPESALSVIALQQKHQSGKLSQSSPQHAAGQENKKGFASRAVSFQKVEEQVVPLPKTKGYAYFASPWEECNQTCGGGIRKR